MTMDLDRANEQIVALERENKILREELATLKLGLFGRRTERLDPGQLNLYMNGATAESALAQDPPTVSQAPATQHAKTDRGHGRARFAEHLPREVIELDLPETERVCPNCGKPLRAIGEDVTERGHVVPAQIVVRRYVRKKYACPDGHAVRTAP